MTTDTSDVTEPIALPLSSTTTMSLIHALVARESTVLAENRSGKRDFSTAVSTILSKIPPNNSKLTYVWEQYLFHYVSENGLTFLVMADDAAGRRMPFTFIADLQQRFTTAYSRDQIEDAPAYGLNEFSPQIGKLIEQYNTAPPVDALSQAQQELAQVKDIMVHNVEQILSRGERIELLVDKTDNMATQSHAFRRGARTVRRQQFWRNQRILALSVFVGFLFLYIFIAQFCGAGLHCRG
ncbi:VAMP/synaptobrevin-like protein [Rhizoctonia solani 123E]|uniref:Synaptobrevin homolog YKT6 n=1 Tax=Rhizoctonia solani 123E TaxID=1423351 RepID=A0A074RFT8_9AGAM|nr:VAMP/synaptobrevin-like protein [Rhizoctonia solani 123E]